MLCRVGPHQSIFPWWPQSLWVWWVCICPAWMMGVLVWRCLSAWCWSSLCVVSRVNCTLCAMCVLCRCSCLSIVLSMLPLALIWKLRWGQDLLVFCLAPGCPNDCRRCGILEVPLHRMPMCSLPSPVVLQPSHAPEVHMLLGSLGVSIHWDGEATGLAYLWLGTGATAWKGLEWDWWDMGKWWWCRYLVLEHFDCLFGCL